MPLRGKSEGNDIKPFKFNIGGNIYKVDTNLFGASVLAILNTIGLLLIG